MQSLLRKSSENLEKAPRIREGEEHWRSEILNPIDNDYWVCIARAELEGVQLEPSARRARAPFEGAAQRQGATTRGGASETAPGGSRVREAP